MHASQPSYYSTNVLFVKREKYVHMVYIELVLIAQKILIEGYTAAIMCHLASAISTFDLGALSPAETTIYSRLDWVFWRGPLFIRSGGVLIGTPDERIMVLRLPKTPAIDLDEPISAEWREGELW
jgi:aminoglycoside 2'-N-acetyltransferase I